MKKAIKSIPAFFFAFIFLAMEMITLYALEPTYTVSDPYKKSIYYTKLKNVSLTGNYHEDIAKIAVSQIGYHEGNSEKELNGGNSYGTGNYTEYGYWYGLQAEWCAMFISWCARQARIPEEVIGNSTFATTGDFGLEFRWKKDYTPVPGDLVIFDYAPYNMVDPGEHGDHVGLVVGVDDKKVYTVEGNAGNAVTYKSYDLTYSEIKGYGIYEEPSVPAETSEETSEKVPEEVSETVSEVSSEAALGDVSEEKSESAETSETSEQTKEEKSSKGKAWLIIAGCAVLCAAAVTVMAIKRKKK